jgi:hypothetical protein
MSVQKNKNQRNTTTRPMRTRAIPRSQRSVPFRKRLVAALRPRQCRNLVMPFVVFIIVLFGGSAVLYRIGHLPQANPVVTAIATKKSTGLVFPQSYLVFQNLSGGTPATDSATTIVGSGGTLLHQFSSNFSQGTFDEYAGSMAPFSSGLLLSNQLSDGTNISVTKWTELHESGSTSPVASTLVGTLNNIWNNSGIVDGNLFLTGTSTAYGVFENSQSFNFQKFNLQTGIVQTVARIRTIGGAAINANDVQPKSMDANQTQISFIMNNVSVNGQAIAVPSVVVYNIASGKFKITALPTSLSDVAPPQASESPRQYGLSADGTLLAYQVGQQATINGIQTTWFTTYVYNTQTGSNVAVSNGTSINLGACSQAFYFSNDDKYLATCGATSVTENAIMEVTNTQTGAVVKDINGGSTNNYMISPAGWIGPDTLVYTTNTTAQSQQFNAATEAAHNINLNTGSGYDYPTGLGELLMVIH